ncbi:heavy-metal-associated domain-containing protein [Facklamia miroungae]|uniref:Copper chaperone n=1 Tax=Facklamia miroungae TaxID=120956 RepID=A0A1G7RK34_9LACT|nr:heavy metal-associated domain-containing protein [Facklamia miroungae]NKZ29401.1 heavy-metal-associated domain-containing protein [Facklamia miroungae]SDG10559.1 copper chaperone [Facklamia miroungae]
MEKQTFTVQGMSCSHCAQTIQDLLLAIDGVENLHIQLDNKEVTIEFQDHLTIEDLNHQLKDTHYQLSKK